MVLLGNGCAIHCHHHLAASPLLKATLWHCKLLRVETHSPFWTPLFSDVAFYLPLVASMLTMKIHGKTPDQIL